MLAWMDLCIIKNVTHAYFTHFGFKNTQNHWPQGELLDYIFTNTLSNPDPHHKNPITTNKEITVSPNASQLPNCFKDLFSKLLKQTINLPKSKSFPVHLRALSSLNSTPHTHRDLNICSYLKHHTHVPKLRIKPHNYSLFTFFLTCYSVT